MSQFIRCPYSSTKYGHIADWCQPADKLCLVDVTLSSPGNCVRRQYLDKYQKAHPDADIMATRPPTHRARPISRDSEEAGTRLG